MREKRYGRSHVNTSRWIRITRMKCVTLPLSIVLKINILKQMLKI